MARFEVTIEREGAELSLEYGFDKLMGFFLTVSFRGVQKADYDCLDDSYSGLPGLLDVLVESGAFSRSDIEEALTSLMTMDSSDIEDKAVQQAAIVIENLKLAAGD